MSGPLTLEQIITFLLETPMFGDLDPVELSTIVSVMQLKHLREGTLVFREGDPGDAFAVREAAEALVKLSAPMIPHLAEEAWAAIGNDSLIVNEAWPQADDSLLVEDIMTLPVQVNGKKRDELTIARDADKTAIEQAALALDKVTKALDGKPVRKVIVVPGRIVNIVG